MLSYTQDTPHKSEKASRLRPEKSRGTTIKITLPKDQATMRGIARAGLVIMGLRSDVDIAAFTK